MSFLFRYILIVIIGLSLSTALYAENILPPQLGEVMQKNENIQKSLLFEQKKINIRKKLSVPLLSLSGEVLPYHTIKKGTSITLSRYDTVDLWVQDIRLDA